MKNLLFLLGILLGCSAGNETVTETIIIPEDSCVPLSGIYLYDFTKTSGSCLPFSQSTIDTDYVGDKDCEVHRLSVSKSQCHYQVEYKCPNSTKGAHAELTGTINLSVDANSGTGTIHFVFVDDDAHENICVSDYNIVFKRK